MVRKVVLAVGIEERREKEKEIRALRERLALFQIEVEEWEPVNLNAGEHGQIEDEGQGCVYITDAGDVAGKLKEAGMCVVFCLTERNRNEPFRGIEYAVESLEGVDGAYLEQVDRRMRGEPWEILETDRLTVREMTVEDVDVLYELYSDASIVRFMGSLPEDREEELQIVADYVEKMYGFYGFGVYMLVEKESGLVVGRAGFSLREGYELPELGYMIRKEEQGKGYAEEACRALMEYGFDRLEFAGIQSVVQVENVPSIGLCRRLGFSEVERLSLDGKSCIRFVTESTE